MRIVGGAWGGRRIRSPSGQLTRPTTDRVREAWMSAIAAELPEATVLDLFAGSGALGLEALSRGARHATFVEQSAKAIQVLRSNLEELSAPPDRYRVVQTDALRFVEKLGLTQTSGPDEGIGHPPFDLALADPPYRQGFATKLADLLRRKPFAEILCLEHAPDERVDGDIVWNRRYGDTILTFLRSGDD